MNKYTKAMFPKFAIAAGAALCAVAAAAFEAALTDPLAWLYADSKIATAERLDEIDVPANGVVDVNILVNGLKPGERLELEASEKDGEWYRMRAVPVDRNTGVSGFLEKHPGDNPHVARRAPFEVFDVLEPLANGDGGQRAGRPTVAVITDAKETEGLYFRMQNPPKGAKSFDIRWQRNQGQDPFKHPYPRRWGGSNNGNSLPSGDTHIVYPGKDGPWPSARLEATRAGMEDADLLTMLRRRDKAKADALVRRIARGFHDYTPSCKLYREVRRAILQALEVVYGPCML